MALALDGSEQRAHPSPVKHALTAQQDALDMTVANSPQHTKEEHKSLIHMQKTNLVNLHNANLTFSNSDLE